MWGGVVCSVYILIWGGGVVCGVFCGGWGCVLYIS